MLKELKDLTYIVRDVESLEILEDQLSNSLEAFQKEAPSDNGLLLQEKPSKKADLPTSKYGPLPVPKKLKSKFTGRVGRANEERKLHNTIDIRPPNKVKENQTLEEKVPVEDASIYDHPIELNYHECNTQPNFIQESLKIPRKRKSCETKHKAKKKKEKVK